MEVIDYNGEGQWSATGILERYGRYAKSGGLVARDLRPRSVEQGERRWIYPVMERVIEGIAAGDRACVKIGIEFIEKDGGFAFGRILKANAARALRRAELTEEQQGRVRRRVFAMLRAGNVPREFGEYAKLARRVGFSARELAGVTEGDRYVERWRRYFLKVLGEIGAGPE